MSNFLAILFFINVRVNYAGFFEVYGEQYRRNWCDQLIFSAESSVCYSNDYVDVVVVGVFVGKWRQL